MRRTLEVTTLVASCVCFLALSYLQWRHVRAGYNLALQVMGPGSPEPSSALHLNFPQWRLYLTSVTALLGAVGILLVLARGSSGIVLLGFALLLALIAGAWDMVQIGSLASPTTPLFLGVTAFMFFAALCFRRSR